MLLYSLMEINVIRESYPKGDFNTLLHGKGGNFRRIFPREVTMLCFVEKGDNQSETNIRGVV